MAKDKTYKEQLKDPRWQKKSQEMKEMYYSCHGCGATESLQTHHKIYRKGLKAWEYENKDLIVLYSGCHNDFHENEKHLKEFLKDNRLFYQYEFKYIIEIVKMMCNIETNDYYEIKKSVQKVLDRQITF